MPYNHAGEIGDVWKHLPLCDILLIEKPLRYHETNSAYSGYNLALKPQVKYGILKLLEINNEIFMNSEYFKVLKRNGIDSLRYTGSPGLAMEVLSDKAQYVFHDIEREALNDVEAYAYNRGLKNKIKTFFGDSIRAFKNDNYLINENDFIFLDPYTPFDANEIGFSFFDTFLKAIKSKSKTLLWYGYESINGQQRIMDCLKHLAIENRIEIWSFDAWLKNMDAHGCEINPGVPGCGLACAHLSIESISILEKYLKFVDNCYCNARYCGNDATLLTRSRKFS